MSKLKATPEWLDAKFLGRPVGVDRENGVIRGFVMAQLGYFKSEGRGQFTDESLNKIVGLAAQKSAGLRSRFTHPSLSSDGLGSYLGRAKGAYRDGDKVRGDLHLDPTSFDTPQGNLGDYVLRLAESDPEAMSSSLVLKTDQQYVLDEKGRPKLDANGNEIPPIWLPTELLASDIVDTGDAVDGLLSAGVQADKLPDGLVRLASAGLDKLFAGCTREVVQARIEAYAAKYLDNRFGPLDLSPDRVIGIEILDVLRRRLSMRERA